jgi:hypothetical protein
MSPTRPTGKSLEGSESNYSGVPDAVQRFFSAAEPVIGGAHSRDPLAEPGPNRS